jgi:hypothetical protein
MIDPSVLRHQRAVFDGIEAPKRSAVNLRLVKPSLRGWAARKPSCECGACRTCKKREAVRLVRAERRPVEPGRPGPKMATDRACQGCRGPIRRDNRSGFCAACHDTAKPRRVGHVARRGDHFSHGGGI